MNRIEELSGSIVNLSESTRDSNKFYSILLDARTSSVSENTYDVADRLLRAESDNAKAALEHLWTLKKTMQNQSEVSTIDLLIQYYQRKMDVVRSKEEHIRKISKDSRNLLEEKRKRDAEIATIRQETADCSAALKELNDKLEKLTVKEQELTLIDTQLKKELLVNENEIINGLYEIILSQQENDNPVDSFTEKLKTQTTEEKPPAQEAQEPAGAAKPAENPAAAPPPEMPLDVEVGQTARDIEKDKTSVYEIDSILDMKKQDETDALDTLTIYQEAQLDEPSPFPKSVVKTTKGRVIGEYYYDAKVYKNKRQYLFNSRFFLKQLSLSLKALTVKEDAGLHAEVMQMTQDAFKRISENPAMHFEIATSEILNEKTLRELWQNLKGKNYVEASRFCRRLNAKLAALRSNYYAMLKEQMQRYAASA
jgi:hypothetical protein